MLGNNWFDDGIKFRYESRGPFNRKKKQIQCNKTKSWFLSLKKLFYKGKEVLGSWYEERLKTLLGVIRCELFVLR